MIEPTPLPASTGQCARVEGDHELSGLLTTERRALRPR